MPLLFINISTPAEHISTSYIRTFIRTYLRTGCAPESGANTNFNSLLNSTDRSNFAFIVRPFRKRVTFRQIRATRHYFRYLAYMQSGGGRAPKSTIYVSTPISHTIAIASNPSYGNDGCQKNNRSTRTHTCMHSRINRYMHIIHEGEHGLKPNVFSTTIVNHTQATVRARGTKSSFTVLWRNLRFALAAAILQREWPGRSPCPFLSDGARSQESKPATDTRADTHARTRTLFVSFLFFSIFVFFCFFLSESRTHADIRTHTLARTRTIFVFFSLLFVRKGKMIDYGTQRQLQG